MSHSIIPVLAMGPGQVIAIIVFTISVLSWFVNLVQGNNPNGAPKPRNRPQPNNQAQSELEKFLQEVVGGGKPQPEPERKRPQPPAPKPQRPQGNTKKSAKSKSPPLRPVESERSATRLAQTHLATSALGEGLRSHVAEHLEARRIDATVQADIDGRVQQDIGTDAATMAVNRAGAVHPLVQTLRNPQGVRQAIMLAEILNRPKSRR
jgi:hypothetical protein